MSKTFQLIRPKSLTNSDYEDYEYLIRWMGRAGEEYLLMFYDAEIRQHVNNELINEEDSDLIQSLVNNVGKIINLTTNDLSKNDLERIGELFENRYVTRLKKDNTIERYAPDRNSYNYELLQGRYEVTFNLILPNIKIWK